MTTSVAVAIPGQVPSSPRRIGGAVRLPGTIRFDTEMDREPNALGVLDRMMRPDHFLNLLHLEAKQRQDILVPDVSDLNMRFKKGESVYDSGFYISPDPKKLPKSSHLRSWFEEHREMRIADLGYKSACQRIERNPDVFGNFQDPAGRFLSEFFDYHRSSTGKGLVVRTSTHGGDEKCRTVDAFAPADLNPISNFELMAATMQRLNEVYGDKIRGVQHLSGHTGDNVCYRVVFGDPIIQESNTRDPNKICFIMLSFMGTEHGLCNTEIDLGFWRMICLNGAMRRDLRFCHATWKRFDSERKFLTKIGNFIDMAGVYGDVMSRRIRSLEEMPLNKDSLRILDILLEQNLLDKRTHATAILASQEREPETAWDLLNILTDSAKSHGNLRRRSNVESRALAIAMQPESFNGVASIGFNKTSARSDLAKEISKMQSVN
jgi:hypothetical protein